MPGLNKNFVVKNGLEISRDLILADAETRFVGIANTEPRTELDVRGGIACTDISSSGIGTFENVKIAVGVATNLDGTNINYSGLGTIANLTGSVVDYTDAYFDTAYTDVGVTTVLSGTHLNYSGLSTFYQANATQLNVTGIATIANLSITGGTFQNITVGENLYVTGFSTFVENASFEDHVTVQNGINAASLNISGVSTVGFITGASAVQATVFYGSAAGLTDVPPGNPGGGEGEIQYNASGSFTGSTGLIWNGESLIVGGGVSVSEGVFVSGVTTALSFSGSGSGLTDGTTPITTLDIDGATDIGADIADADLFVVDDGAGGTNRKTAASRIKTYVLGGGAGANFTNINVSGIATIQDITVNGQFDVYDSQAVFHNDLYIAGNLSIGGTSTSIISQELKVSDADIVLGVTTASNGDDIANDTTANHGGIAVASTEGNPLVDLTVAGIETLPPTYKKIMWFKSGAFAGLGTDAWLINYAVGVGSTQVPNGVRFAAGGVQLTDDTIKVNGTEVLSPTTLGSGVVNSSLTSVGTLGQLNVTGVATAQDFDALSDVNFKENINTVEGALSKVQQLRGVSFNWKESGKPSYGVIAQELESVLPELVHGEDPRTVNYNGIIGVLIEAIKELSDRLDSQTT